MARALVVGLVFGIAFPVGRAAAQDAPVIDPKRVDAAIRKGVAYLQNSGVVNPSDANKETPELILWTFVHAGVPQSDPGFRDLFKTMVEGSLERTYKVALQAMILEEIDRVKYQQRIAFCAQFLLDNQCLNGQWSYGQQTVIPNAVPTISGKSGVATGGKAGVKEVDPHPAEPKAKPAVTRKLTVKAHREGPATGDNSNSQYAALGLRACHDSGILLPKEALERGRRWWRDSQHEPEAAVEKNGVVTGDAPQPQPPAGWCYGPKDHGHRAYGSMTAGAVGSLAIYGYILGEDWKKDATTLKGIEWLTRNYSVGGNMGPAEHNSSTTWMHYYYLYALERAGVLFGTETLGKHQWYPEGADLILNAQGADGSWLSGTPHGDRSDVTNRVWDSCFAILFLKRATRPLVVSVDRFAKPQEKPQEK